MLNRWTSVALFGVVWGLSPSVNAEGEPRSYVADNQCFCNLPASSFLNDRIVATPVGGQSVAQVCERIGTGPALTKNDGEYNFPVYDDTQCGHGPGYSGFVGLLNESGTDLKEGPKWDLAAAYATSTESSPVSADVKLAAAQPVEPSDTSDVVPVAKSDDTPQTSLTRRFKSRYVQAPETTSTKKVSDGVDKGIDKPIASKPKPKASTRKLAAKSSAPTLSQKQIEQLPLAKTEPLQDAADAAVATTKVTEAPSSTIEKATSAELLPLNEEASITVKETVTQEAASNQKEIQQVAENISSSSDNATPSLPVSNALRLPESVRASSQEFAYISLMPVNYEFGGNGGRFTASYAQNNKVRYILRAAAAETYQEVSVGASYIVTPRQADRLTFALTAGVEYGNFTLQSQSVETTVDDTGVFAQFGSRFVVNNRFELQGGLGVSGFFEGDPHAFGAALYHLTKTLDLSGEFEVGDNDSVGLGIRYYY